MKTFMLRKEDVDRKWCVIDAEGKVLGRLATEIAMILMGKKKANYTPHVDNGDFVIVINCEKIAVTGNKLQDKMYYNYSGYKGGMRERNLKTVLEKRPEDAIEWAVKRMLPKNKLAKDMFSKLKVYVGAEHPHAAQQPVKIEL